MYKYVFWHLRVSVPEVSHPPSFAEAYFSVRSSGTAIVTLVTHTRPEFFPAVKESKWYPGHVPAPFLVLKRMKEGFGGLCCSWKKAKLRAKKRVLLLYVTPHLFATPESGEMTRQTFSGCAVPAEISAECPCPLILGIPKCKINC